MLGEPFDGGIAERRQRGIVLVIVLQRHSVFGCWLVVEIGDGLIGDEIGGLRKKNIFREIQAGREIRIRRREQVLAIGKFCVQELKRNAIDSGCRETGRWVCGGSARGTICISEILVNNASERRRAAIVGQTKGHCGAGGSDFQVGSVRVLVADECEKFVFD